MFRIVCSRECFNTANGCAAHYVSSLVGSSAEYLDRNLFDISAVGLAKSAVDQCGNPLRRSQILKFPFWGKISKVYIKKDTSWSIHGASLDHWILATTVRVPITGSHIWTRYPFI